MGQLFGDTWAATNLMATALPVFGRKPATCKTGPAAPYHRHSINQSRSADGHHFNSERVYPAFELCIERLHDSAMLCDARHAGEGRRGDAHPKMRLPAFAIAAVTPVIFAFVEDFKMAWRKFERKNAKRGS